MRTRLGAIFLLVLAPTLLCSVVGIPFALELGILCTAAGLWISELIPPGITGLLIPVMIVVLGLATPTDAFSHFGNQIIFLLIGSLLLVRAIQEHGVDSYLASLVLRLGSRGSLNSLAFVLGACTWLVGMWMSNTACTLVFLPIVLGALNAVFAEIKDPQLQVRCSCRLLLTISLLPSIGGMLTPIGSLPNAVALGFLAEAQLRVPLFGEWMLSALPLSVLLAVIIGLLLHLRYPLGEVDLRTLASLKAQAPVRLSVNGRRVLAIVGLVVLLLVVPSILAQFIPTSRSMLARLPMGVCACAGAILLFIVPTDRQAGEKTLLTGRAMREIDLNPVFLLAGSLSLGKLLLDSGLARALGEQLVATSAWWSGAVVVSAVLATILLSEVGSNTAAASIMVPVVLSALQSLGQQGVVYDSVTFVMGIALASGLGSMLPASTPPNAIVFATGRVPLGEMVKTGILVDLCGLLAVVAWITLL